MTGFEMRWLDLREEADHVARDAGLRAQAIDHLQDISSARIVDLGCGTGSTLRALLPEAASCHWRLVDNDPLLLAEAMTRQGSSGHVECVKRNLDDPDGEIFKGANLVTASALFDLVSEEFLARLVATLNHQKIGLYTALNYDGAIEWEIPLAMDAKIVLAFNTHQRRDKGFGPALGPSARKVLQDLFLSGSFNVSVAASPWKLEAVQSELQRHLIDGMANAVAETGMIEMPAIEDWRMNRIGLIDRSGCKVGHWDMLAVPKQ